MKWYLIFFIYLFSFKAIASFIDPRFPQPSLPVQKSLTGADTHELFKEVTENFQKVYKDNILFQIKTRTRRANAYATYDENDRPLVVVTMPMLSHPRMNKETLILLLCHELGHFYAGAPKKLRGDSNKKSWASSEGQADYYASSVCFKKFFPKQRIQKKKEFKDCDSICENTLKTSYNLAKLFAEIKFDRREISLDQKDHEKVREVLLEHTTPQCRLDTFSAGAKCLKKKNVNHKGMIIETCDNKNFRQPECWLPSYLLEDI